MKLLVYGYFGFGNEGDELLLEVLRREFSNQELTVLSADPTATAARHNVRSIGRSSAHEVLAELTRCDALVAGGGGLVQDLSGPWSPAYYLGLAALASALGKRVVWLAQGFGPVQRAWNRTLSRLVLRWANLVVARDPAGLAWCRALYVPEAKLSLGADLAWLLPAPHLQGAGPVLNRSAAKRSKPPAPRREWALCLRADWNQGVVPAWAAGLIRVAAKFGRKVRCTALGDQGDRELLGRMRLDPRFRGCRFLSVGPDSGSAAGDLFAGTELVVSQRYHGLILGALAGAAVTGFGPDPKLAQLVSELHQPASDPLRLCAQAAQMASDLKRLQKRAAIITAALRARATAGVDAVRRVLGLTRPN